MNTEDLTFKKAHDAGHVTNAYNLNDCSGKSVSENKNRSGESVINDNEDLSIRKDLSLKEKTGNVRTGGTYKGNINTEDKSREIDKSGRRHILEHSKERKSHHHFHRKIQSRDSDAHSHKLRTNKKRPKESE